MIKYIFVSPYRKHDKENMLAIEQTEEWLKLDETAVLVLPKGWKVFALDDKDNPEIGISTADGLRVLKRPEKDGVDE